jgi:flagellum-specific ATP synthase
MATFGRGMRAGLFAGSGVGKSTLLGMVARHAGADCVVIAMIGERGREVREFIEDHLGASITRSVVVVSAADSPPLARLHGAMRAASIAEYFRDRGRHVLFLVDSLTRLAMAGREIGLSVGEPAATKGYPPSVFGRLAAYVERAGNGGPGQGSITGLYTVLVEADDHVGDPIADVARSVLDGHIVLSRRSSEAGIYPPIDLTMSLSRPMSSIVTAEHAAAAGRFRLLWSRFLEKRELIDIGAYAPGRDPVLDQAIARMPRMEAFLRQPAAQKISVAESIEGLQRAIADSEKGT